MFLDRKTMAPIGTTLQRTSATTGIRDQVDFLKLHLPKFIDAREREPHPPFPKTS